MLFRSPNSPSLLADAGTTIVIRKPRLDDPHPNTYRIHATRDGATHELISVSTGGGMIEVIELDGWKVSMFGDYAVTLLVVEGNAAEVAAAIDEKMVDEVVVCERSDGAQLVIVSAQKPLEEIRTDALPGVVAVHRLRSVLPVRSRRGLSVPFAHASEMTNPELLDQRPLSDWAIAYETARGGIDESEVLTEARRILEIMQTGVRDRKSVV